MSVLGKKLCASAPRSEQCSSQNHTGSKTSADLFMAEAVAVDEQVVSNADTPTPPSFLSKENTTQTPIEGISQNTCDGGWFQIDLCYDLRNRRL